MKIAILTPTFSEFSGIDRVVEKEAENFFNEGHDVTIFCFKSHMQTKYAKVIEIELPKNPALERIYRLIFFIDFIKIRRTVKMLKGFDKIICHQYPMTILGSKAKKKYRSFFIYHNAGVAFPNLFSNPIEKVYMALFNFFTNKSIKNVDKAISISKFLRDVLKKETGIKSNVEYVSIDKKRFHKGIDGSKIRVKYGLGKDSLCLYVGRISPHKGIHYLIESFNLVLRSQPNVKLLIVGKKTFGNYARKLEKLACKVKKDAIIFTDFVPDTELPYYYAACDVYTTATLWEGFDMPLVEAYYCGKPSVAFNIGAHPEVIKNGKLIKTKDIISFSKAILQYIK
jgi:1,2-diacylglycerol 3-alpha-glucosyltransferase